MGRQRSKGVSVIDDVLAARRPEHLFHVADAVAIESHFRDLAMMLHPDRCKDPRASDAMARLNALRDEATKKIAAGTFGKVELPTITTKAALYTSVQPLPGACGDLFDVYWAFRQSAARPSRGDISAVVIKLLRNPRDEDLARAEWSALQKLWTAPVDKENGEFFQKYLPRPIESVRVSVGGKERVANVLRLSGKKHTLLDVMRAYPDGIDARDMAWMFRRVLEILAWVHNNGLVHGAILPEHVLVGVDDHSAKLVDWSYSVPVGEKIKAIVSARSGWYPPEVKAKMPATAATDVYMAARLARDLVGAQILPPRIASLLDAATIPSPHRRLPSAREVYQRFDTVLRGLYGPPKFRPFEMK